MPQQFMISAAPIILPLQFQQLIDLVRCHLINKALLFFDNLGDTIIDASHVCLPQETLFDYFV